MAVLEGALESHDCSKDRTPGQHFVQLPDRAVELVSCGEGRVPVNRADAEFVVREWRGQQEEFLTRRHATPATGTACVVYTTKAYLADEDPDLTPEEKLRVAESGATHVIVAVLAFGGPNPRHTLKSGKVLGLTSPTRLEANLAGGNKDFSGLTEYEIAEIREATARRWAEWRTVAD
jgi:hypothetical protein